MAKVDIQYCCGCGFKSKDLEAASTHCDTAFHDLTISGIVHSSTRTSARQAAVDDKHRGHSNHDGSMGSHTYARKTAPQPQKPIEPTPEAKEKVIHDSFESLKAKLGRKT
jgi:hypothetical protein